MSYNSFVYDIGAENFDTERPITTKCCVHFRPKKKWRGEDYGFDWIRIGEGRDILYAESMGKYYTQTDKNPVIQSNVNSYGGTFIRHPELYDQLLDQYFKDRHKVLWKKPKNPMNEIPKGDPNRWKYHKELTKYVYYTPVMTLGVDVTAELKLIVEFEDKKNPPDKIYIRACNEELFEISHPELSKDGDYTCTIKCLKIIEKEEFIEAIAITKLANGEESEAMCGRLRILSNKLKCNKLKILCVEIALRNKNATSAGKIVNTELDIAQQILNQALIKCEVERVAMTIDINTYIFDIQNDQKYKMSYFLNDNNEFKRNTGLPTVCRFAFQQQLLAELRSRIDAEAKVEFAERLENAITVLDREQSNATIAQIVEERYTTAVKKSNPFDKYKHGYCMFFFFPNNCVEKVQEHNGMEQTSQTQGSTEIDNRSVVLFGSRSGQTLAHELLHTLGLYHSFNDGGQWPNACFTYKAAVTDNVLDYDNKKIATWHWQWKLIWKKINELSK